MQNEFLQSKKSEFAELKEYIDSVKNSQGVTMQILQKAQSLFGYLPLEVQQFISDETNIPLADIYGVVTFTHSFPRKKRVNTKLIMSWYSLLRKGLAGHFRQDFDELNVKVGKTTDDKLFT